MSQPPNKSTRPYNIAAMLIIVTLLGGAWLLNENKPASPPTSQTDPDQTDALFRPVDETDHIRGPVTAPFTILEYGDIACAFCQAYHPRIKKLLAQHPHDIRWVWRSFPHDVNVEAYIKAQAAECAAEQGQFWEFIDAVFIAGVNLSVAELSQVAEVINLDVERLETCIASNKFETTVQFDVAEASRLGGTATPFTIIITPDNQFFPLAGAASFEQLNGLFNDLLSGTNPTFDY